MPFQQKLSVAVITAGLTFWLLGARPALRLSKGPFENLTAQPDSRSVTLELVAKGLEMPVHAAAPPGDEERLFIVEKSGKVKILKDGRILPEPFLDLSFRVGLEGQEQGLLSIAFHPRYQDNRRFYCNYTDRWDDTRVVEFQARPDQPDRADPASGRQILKIEQPFRNHNGGLILFGPDGYLYIGTGDGGAGGDPYNHSQNSSSLLGKLLRIDVDTGGDSPYAIPPTNPFVADASARPEIWALGLRNPWRFSFDRVTGDLYIADVGQNRFEEVHVAPSISRGGENYGWNVVEGLGHRYRRSGRDPSGFSQPLVEYGRDVGCSIIGGHVYRGRDIPDLVGQYFYGDFCTGVIRSFRYRDGEAAERLDWTGSLRRIRSIASFAEDARGELYIIS
ncbi:MAG: PQQ-dependent sugar dehydrogenase [Planctomycetota bacterium]|nr:PQQ-dependent sugar dehydrogenase [Planctomycetota bacterium]